MRESSVVAGIITFNPDIARLRENLRAVVPEVGRLLIVDNASRNIELVEAILREFPSVEIRRNGQNRGIAVALNQVMAWASERHAEWAMLLDQDSVISSGMVSDLSGLTSPELGIVCPTIVDRSSYSESSADSSPLDVDYCITSGSLCSVAAWKAIDEYDEAMFIDFVDFDYCLRLRESGFRIVRTSQAVLLHEIGKITRHGRATAYHHSSFRSYHMARDMLYYAYKHRRSERALMVQRRGLAGTYLVLLRKAVIVGLFEEDRLRRVAAIARGLVAGTFALRRAA